ncbi:MAG: hypothetical protein J0H01_17605 [Rhizobiales bacterium]|nr:hypothetical protein [Hyphomicrobiales bacterium]
MNQARDPEAIRQTLWGLFERAREASSQAGFRLETYLAEMALLSLSPTALTDPVRLEPDDERRRRRAPEVET